MCHCSVFLYSIRLLFLPEKKNQNQNPKFFLEVVENIDAMKEKKKVIITTNTRKVFLLVKHCSNSHSTCADKDEDSGQYWLVIQADSSRNAELSRTVPESYIKLG